MYLVGDPKELIPEGRKRIRKPITMIDVGCGTHPQSWLNAEHHICIEPHPIYYQILRSLYWLAEGYKLLNVQWDVLKLATNNSVDLVIAVDFIEHLTHPDGIEFLIEANRIARHQIALFTPWGPYPQDYDNDTIMDLAGYPGLHWQTHKSAWTPDDFPGWDIVACKEYHRHDGNGNELDKPIGAFWAIKDLT